MKNYVKQFMEDNGIELDERFYLRGVKEHVYWFEELNIDGYKEIWLNEGDLYDATPAFYDVDIQ